MSICIKEVYFVKHGSPKSGKNIRDFIVGTGKPIPSVFVNAGDVFVFTHKDIKDGTGKEFDPFKGEQKDIIIVVEQDGVLVTLHPFPERNTVARTNQDREIRIAF